MAKNPVVRKCRVHFLQTGIIYTLMFLEEAKSMIPNRPNRNTNRLSGQNMQNRA